MNLIFRIKHWLVVVSGSISMLVPPAKADTPAFAFAGSSTEPPPSFTGTRGWSFFNYRPEGAILITQLGVFDAGGDGLVNSHAIGLWALDGTLLASATVPAGTGAPLIDGYRYASISPVIIPRATSEIDPNTAFILAAQYSTADADDLLTPFSAGLTPGIGGWSGNFPSIGWYGLGSDLPFPNRRTQPTMEGSGGRIFWEPNFQFGAIPEPSVFSMLAPGLLYLFVRQRKVYKRNEVET